jgi:exodeoxyribonuclease V
VSNPLNTKQFEGIFRNYLPFVPTTDQEQAIQKLSQFLFTANEQTIFILKGYAGTGKTNLVSALAKALPSAKWNSVLLAPTGRAAKVLGSNAQKLAQTIHKKIFRKSLSGEGQIYFSQAENTHKNTLFIVDEASMIGPGQDTGGIYSNLLESLLEYIFSGENCKLLFVGDTAQLPPVGSNESPALSPEYLKQAYSFQVHHYELKQVARQKQESGILYNATNLRQTLVNPVFELPKLFPQHDIIRLAGDELEDALNSAYSNYGEENVLIVTRSNKRANLYNQNVRNRIKYVEEELCAGDRLMVVKNNYFWLNDTQQKDTPFIANGDIAEVTRIHQTQSLYGFHFSNCNLRFSDYEHLPDVEALIIRDSLYSDSPGLTPAQQQELFANVMEDVAHEPIKGRRIAYLKQSPHFNALQVKFSYAVTCHKSQGGQWPVVFIDQGYVTQEMMDVNFIRWLYTAITRATEKVYLINFNEVFF